VQAARAASCHRRAPELRPFHSASERPSPLRPCAPSAVCIHIKRIAGARRFNTSSALARRAKKDCSDVMRLNASLALAGAKQATRHALGLLHGRYHAAHGVVRPKRTNCCQLSTACCVAVVRHGRCAQQRRNPPPPSFFHHHHYHSFYHLASCCGRPR
jgi:hypothetical protein